MVQMSWKESFFSKLHSTVNARSIWYVSLPSCFFKQENNGKIKEEIVSAFINPEKGAATYEEAISGAQDIIAENIADNEYRLINSLRNIIHVCQFNDLSLRHYGFRV